VDDYDDYTGVPVARNPMIYLAKTPISRCVREFVDT
jgi:hypothetical protein